MKNFIQCDNLYGDINQLSILISSLEFVDVLHGKEIEDFYYVPQGLDHFFSMVDSQQIEIQPNTGTFRKPNSLIYFDNFYEHTLWACIAALEETELKLYEHELGYRSFFDVPKDTNMDQFFIDNCNDPTKWIIKSVINIPKNSFVFIRPWLWKSLLEDKLVQVFMINQSLYDKIKEES
jgi:hypothetical protein